MRWDIDIEQFGVGRDQVGGGLEGGVWVASGVGEELE